MINKEIPTFAKMLLAQEDSLLKLWTQPRSSDSTDRILREVEGVISKLHKCGINLRYLNLLRYHLCRNRSQLWSKLIFTEMVARTVKVNLNQALRHAMSLWQLPSGTLDNNIRLCYHALNSSRGALPKVSRRFHECCAW